MVYQLLVWPSPTVCCTYCRWTQFLSFLRHVPATGVWGVCLLSIGTSLALFWMFSFLIWTHLVTLGYHGHRYSTSYGMFSTCSSLSHPHTPVSASYNSSDMVGVWNTLMFVSLFQYALWNTFICLCAGRSCQYVFPGWWRSQPIRLIAHTNGTSPHSTASKFDFSALIAIPYFLHTMSTAFNVFCRSPLICH